jgi:hypothetical protein
LQMRTIAACQRRPSPLSYPIPRSGGRPLDTTLTCTISRLSDASPVSDATGKRSWLYCLSVHPSPLDAASCRSHPEGMPVVFVLGLAAWLVCSVLVAVLVGYCALGEEKDGAASPHLRQRSPRIRPISILHHHLAPQHPVERPDELALAPGAPRPLPLGSHGAGHATAPH